MVDILDPKEISLVDKNQLLLVSSKSIIPYDNVYNFQRLVSKNKKESYQESLNEINNLINKNVQFPNKLMIDGHTHLFRRRKRELHWHMFPAGKFNEEDITVSIPYSGMFVLLNASLDPSERIYINDIPIDIKPHNNIIKFVRKGELIRLNSSLSEDNVVLIWFVVLYEKSE